MCMLYVIFCTYILFSVYYIGSFATSDKRLYIIYGIKKMPLLRHLHSIVLRKSNFEVHTCTYMYNIINRKFYK